LKLHLDAFEGVVNVKTIGERGLIELTYPKHNGKSVRTHRETLLVLFMMLPKKFSASNIKVLLNSIGNFGIDKNASPHLIMKFFSVAFSDNCKIVNVNNKKRLEIEKT